jgi:protein-S-isoprenylcysteine O-methyltransferase Ste14
MTDARRRTTAQEARLQEADEIARSQDNPHVVIRPPIALALAAALGTAASWLYPLPFVPAPVPAGWVGATVFAIAFLIAAWAIVTMRRAGTRFETHRPATRIVGTGPYRFTRNPIYIGMFLALGGLAIGLDNLWLVAALVPFYAVIRYGVVAREEAYLERKFGNGYLDYKARVRRWL